MSEKNIKWLNVKKIAEKTWIINDNNRVAMYLVEGRNKALLIDTGWGVGNLCELVKLITSLPVTVVVTHGHPDHVCGAYQFDNIYVSKEDKDLMYNFYNKETRIHLIERSLKSTYPTEFTKEQWINAELKNVYTVEDGYVFDLGDRKLTVIAVPGHTPGSICLLDEAEKMLFTGDSIQASPILMHLETSLSLNTYFNSLNKVNSYSHKFNVLLPCHGESPINNNVLDDLLEGISGILEGKLVAKLQQTFFGEGLVCIFKTSEIIYDESRL